MERILVALDGSEHGDKALDLASDIAGKYDAELVLLHVMSDEPLTERERYAAETEYLDDLVESLQAPVIEGDDPRQQAQRVLRHYADVTHRFRAAAKGARSVRTLLEDGDPADTILRLAKELPADMVFLGTRGLGNVKGLLMGSVSHKVAHLAECTCVSVK